jgi:nucleotide-binding universal stress UspA family protein
VIEAARAQAQAGGIALEAHLLLGHPVHTIVTLVNEEHFELLVVGFMGHTRLYQQIIGSTTERLVRLAPCAVLVIK